MLALKLCFFVGETKTGKPGKQEWGEEQFLGLSRSEPVVGNPQNLFSFRKSFTSDLQSVFCIHGQKATPVESGKTNFSKLPTLYESFSNEEIINCYE